MTCARTSAEVRFGPDGVTKVDSFVRLTGNTYIGCYTYDDSAPILAVRDGHVIVSVSVPDTAQVTAEDVQQGRALAEAAARYVAGLERRAASQDSAAGEAA
jgi:hypothetical protein